MILSKPVKFITNLKYHFYISLMLGVLLIAIIILVEPYDTELYDLKYKKLFFNGYGFLTAIAYLFYSFLEIQFQKKSEVLWTQKKEVISFFLFFIISSTTIYFYHSIVMHEYKHSLFAFMLNFTLPLYILLLPFLLFFRFYFGTLNEKTLSKKNTLTIYDVHKKRPLTIIKTSIIYVKSADNYLEIFEHTENNKVQKHLIRSTFSDFKKQLIELTPCHRSYLINLEFVSKIIGNSNHASLDLKHINTVIPISKTYYKTLKQLIGSSQKVVN